MLEVICLFIAFVAAWIKLGFIAAVGITAALIVLMPHAPQPIPRPAPPDPR